MKKDFKRVLLLVSTSFFMTGTVSAAWYVDVCAAGQAYGGVQARQGPFSTRAQAQAFADSENRGTSTCFSVSGSDDAAASTSAVPSSGDGMLGMAKTLGTEIGQGIGDWLFPSAAEQEQQRLWQQQQNLIAQQKRDAIAAEQAREAAEQERLANEKQAKLKSQLKPVDGVNPPQQMGMKTMDSSSFASVDSSSDDGFMQAPAKPQHHRNSQVYNQKSPNATPTTGRSQKSVTPGVTPPADHDPQGPDSHANLEVDGVELMGNPMSEEKDEIVLTNTNDYAVSVNVLMKTGSKNCSHSLESTVTLNPGDSAVKIGWVGNTDGWGPWNYEMGMNVSKAGGQ